MERTLSDDENVVGDLGNFGKVAKHVGNVDELSRNNSKT